MAQDPTIEKAYYIKRIHKKTGEIVHIGHSDKSTIQEKLKEYKSREDDEYEYSFLEFVYMAMPEH